MSAGKGGGRLGAFKKDCSVLRDRPWEWEAGQRVVGRPWGCGSWMDCAVEIIGLCSWNPTAVSRISARACGPSDGTVCQLVMDTRRPRKDSTHLFFFFAPTFPLESPCRWSSPGGASGPVPLSPLLLSAGSCFLGSLLTLRPSDLL